MSAVTLTPRALYEEVAELLRQRIFASELEPGSWIDEMRLAEEYGISRTPLREALRLLEASSLVVRQPRRSVRVAPMTRENLDQVFACRVPLEALAAVERTAREAAAASVSAAQAEEAIRPLRDAETIAAAVLNRLAIDKDRLEREGEALAAEVAKKVPAKK